MGWKLSQHLVLALCGLLVTSINAQSSRLQITFPPNDTTVTDTIVQVVVSIDSAPGDTTEEILYEGENIIIREADLDGETFADTVVVTKRCQLCLVQIYSPENDHILNREIIDVGWSVDGRIQKRDTVDTLQPGENTIRREVQKNSGGTSGDSITVTYDPDSPIITPIGIPLLTLENGRLQLGPFGISDDYKLSRVWALLTYPDTTVALPLLPDSGDASGDFSGDSGTYRLDTLLADAAFFSIALNAKDSAGNLSTITDFQGPDIDPANRATELEDTTLTLSGITIKDTSGVHDSVTADVQYPDSSHQVPLTRQNADSDDWQLQLPYTLNEELTITLTARDSLGNVSQMEFSAIVEDSENPVLSTPAIPPSAWSSDDSSLTIPSWDFTDNGSGPYTITYTYIPLDGSTMKTVYEADVTTPQVDSLIIPHAANTLARLEISVADDAGNTASDTLDLPLAAMYPDSNRTFSKATWHLVGVPFSLTLADFEDNISPSKTSYTLETVDDNTFVQHGFSRQESLPHLGGFLWGSFAGVLSLPDEHVFDGFPDSTIALKTGWNLVCSPYPFPVSYNITTGGEAPPTLYELNSDGAWVTAEEMQPYRGYAVFGEASDSLHFMLSSAQSKTGIHTVNSPIADLSGAKTRSAPSAQAKPGVSTKPGTPSVTTPSAARSTKTARLTETNSGQTLTYGPQFREAPYLPPPQNPTRAYWQTASGNQHLLHLTGSELQPHTVILEVTEPGPVRWKWESANESALLLNQQGENVLDKNPSLVAGSHVFTLVTGDPDDLKYFQSNFSASGGLPRWQWIDAGPTPEIRYILPSTMTNLSLSLWDVRGKLLFRKNLPPLAGRGSLMLPKVSRGGLTIVRLTGPDGLLLERKVAPLVR